MDKYSFLGSLHIEFYEKLYNQYLENPDSVDSSWRSFFQGYDFAHESYNILPTDLPTVISKEFQVISLIDDFRKRGHLFTKTNPVRDRRDYSPKLDIDDIESVLCETEYEGHKFVSAVNKENIYGLQFHPERSGDKGLALLDDINTEIKF